MENADCRTPAAAIHQGKCRHDLIAIGRFFIVHDAFEFGDGAGRYLSARVLVISTRLFGFPLGVPAAQVLQAGFRDRVRVRVPLGRLGLLPPRGFGSSSMRVFLLSSFAPLPYYRWPVKKGRVQYELA